MVEKQFDLSGRVAVVTGGLGVLGGSIAECLADAGANIALIDLDVHLAEERIAALEQKGVEAAAFETNVLDGDVLRKSRDEVVDRFGRVDILINAAGGNIARARTDDISVFQLPFDAYDDVVRLNLHGTVYPTLVFGEAIANQKKGSIVNISSMAAMRAMSGVPGYASAKAAVDNFTRWMAVELAREHGEGLRVNAIAPGFFVTTQNRDVLLNADGSYTERSRQILYHTPMGRFGDPKELQGPVLWLCSDASSFVTGVVIPVDGGFSAYSGL